ncbi:hypothetical protein SAMN05421736_116125 [Evansella caseinilytica]|uniref:Uncharacterized protein n=1 Tax=Evansella caseinilytica TaxID=1503961 RepID=A0A1H3TX88_9BACI|nr:hypothetical protein [Evansella caseinilytica]SDZ54830.1 hypothetical protein SAMN05421736_116125 [Evansella caseinilytica]
MAVTFLYDDRLGISVPYMLKEWEELSPETRESTLETWEGIRGVIPDRIKELEKEISLLQRYLNEEDEFEKSCMINSEISELASIINDLWIWYRSGEEVQVKLHF